MKFFDIRKIQFGKYAYEFLSIFIAVVAAFALNNWNDNRRDEVAASKILLEIYNGLGKDIMDAKGNEMGHQQGIQSCQFWRKVITNQPVELDSSIGMHYSNLTRDFLVIQNTSGYETLKSRGLELITNDTLRSKIISIYEFDFNILRKFEEEYKESQFHDTYFMEINRILAPSFNYDEKNKISGLNLPIEMSSHQRKLLLSYLHNIELNRKFILQFYSQLEEKTTQLRADIVLEIARMNE